MRVYLPASLPIVRSWVTAASVGPLPLTGFAVTPGLREWYTSAQLEELEYAATARAARASLRMIPLVEPRRVVVVADVPDEALVVRDDLEEGAIQLRIEMPWHVVACALIDANDAETAVTQAIGVVDAADLGDAEAEFVVSEAEDHDLQWFAAQELADL